MQSQYKIHKLGGCVKVNQKFHYKTRYRNQELVNYCRAEQGSFNDGRQVYNVQLSANERLDNCTVMVFNGVF